LDPEFVVNYGGPGRLKYMKTQVTIRLADSTAAEAVRHHLPFIRNNLVMLFASQTDDTLEAQDGRESMRAAALAEVRDLLLREDDIGPEGVVDVLFNKLTWH
jgi:flagellar FliL protein